MKNLLTLQIITKPIGIVISIGIAIILEYAVILISHGLIK